MSLKYLLQYYIKCSLNSYKTEQENSYCIQSKMITIKYGMMANYNQGLTWLTTDYDKTSDCDQHLETMGGGFTG